MRNLFLLAGLCVPLAAQVTGRVSGTVVDASGAAVPDAAVRLVLAGGARAALETKTTGEGLFALTGVRPETYDLTVEKAGFVPYAVRGLKVDPARETALAAIRLELPAVAQSVEVRGEPENVQVSNAEVSTTVTNAQVRRLPVLDRDPLRLVQTQAGVTSNGVLDTTINGQRASFANVTVDGINVQDNFIRDNALDYVPNMLLIDQVGEFTVSTSNAHASFGGGSAQISYSTPSGTNALHGSAYWYNRNSAAAANQWFNNRSGVKRPLLNQNQAGFSLGGPVIRDRLFFYGNYEGYRQHQQTSVNRTVLTANARQGLFRYLDNRGVEREADLLKTAGVSADPVMQKLLALVPETINNTDVGDGRNTAGYRFLKRDNRTRDNLLGKLDFNLSPRHVFAGTWMWNRDNSDRPDYDNDFSPVPKVSNLNRATLFSAAWRWTPSASLTNELRGGFNRTLGDFPTTEQFGPYILEGMVYSNPVNTSRRQGRDTNTYSLADNAAWIRGRHNVQFGFQAQRVTAPWYDDTDITPTYYIGIGFGNEGIDTLPGIRSLDLSNANDLLATLAGYVTGYWQTFNITSRTSGFVPGAPMLRNYSLDEYALYAQDNWKLRPHLTFSLGLRYALYGVVDERDSLALLPRLGGNPVSALLSNATLDFAGASAGRPWYGRDRNNFAPNVGLAWDVAGNGRTALRAGYSISYVNDQTVLAPIVITDWNAGLTASAYDEGLTARVSTGLPRIPVPQYKVPRTFQDNYDLDSQSEPGAIDPHLRTPYVQQWTFGIQREFKRTIFEARYVGNHAVGALRAFDYNQVMIRENGFLDDFIRAQNNGRLALAATGRFDPSYNANIAGSQRLTVFPRLAGGGRLTNSTIRGLIERGEAGQLAAKYQIDGMAGSVSFFPNPHTLGADLLTNFSSSSYNALQLEVRRRSRGALEFQANYTFAKVLSDSAGTSQSRLEYFLDLNNPGIERARADFDITHSIKGNAVWDLPLARKHRWLGGWTLSGMMTWQSGTPFSILSARGTLNRTGYGRSDLNTASTTLNKAQLDDLLSFRMTGGGPYFVAPSAIGGDGRAVAADGQAPFSGQVFFHPGPGALGGLQRRMFSGPWGFQADLGVLKSTRIAERHSLELRMEAANAFNHPTFVVWDQRISSANFGRITSTLNWARVVQFGAYYRF
ncbi:MAG: carboxypeptidase regulatory-like domain-containing protein [Bryobacteraceae bacterium]